MNTCVNVGGVCKCVWGASVGGCARACGHAHVSVRVGVSVWTV